MKTLRTLVIALILTVAGICVALTAGAQQDRKQPRQLVWEYRDGANLTIGQLNALGADGWELIVTTPYDKNLYYILKRQKI